MRSGELARLAGVSVRTLRHYHQLDVLTEPERSSNGYRHYDVHDLIRLLRIRRLAALGIPLEQMTPLLDEPGAEADTLLDDLDRELADQIERISGQREMIARLRADHGAPDLPPELAGFLTVFTAVSLSPAATTFDRDQTVLLAHFVGEEGMPNLARFYERLTAPELVPAGTALAERFAALGPETDDHEVDAVVDSLLTTFGPMVHEFGVGLATIPLADSAKLFDDYTNDQLNDAQLRVLEQIEARLAGGGTKGRTAEST